MPELPEVETVVNGLRPKLAGERIRQIQRFWHKAFVPDEAIDDLVGREIRDLSRRAKYIFIHLDVGYLIVHLRMTGRMSTRPPAPDREKYITVQLDFESGNSLYFEDVRKFGRLIYSEMPGDVLPKLGPEPLSPGFTSAGFAEMLKKRNRQIKPLLLDQSFLAGVGNIYADEALFRAKIHPLTMAKRIPPDKIATLHRAIRKILRDSIRYQGTTVLSFVHGNGETGSYQDMLRIYGHAGEPCPNCNTAIEKVFVGQRGTHFCPNCQQR